MHYQLFFDPEGNPYPGDVHEQVEAWMKDFPNRFIKKTLVCTGYEVSTIWNGLDAIFIPGLTERQPRIYETAIFNADGSIRDIRKHATKEEAIIFHDACVEVLEKGDFEDGVEPFNL